MGYKTTAPAPERSAVVGGFIDQAGGEVRGLIQNGVTCVDKAGPGATLGEPDLMDLRFLARDEFEIKRGHRHATNFAHQELLYAAYRCCAQAQNVRRDFEA